MIAVLHVATRRSAHATPNGHVVTESRIDLSSTDLWAQELTIVTTQARSRRTGSFVHRSGVMAKLLIVDQHAVVRRGLHQILSEAFPGGQFGEAGTADEASALLARERWNVMIIDPNLAGRDGHSLLDEAKRAGVAPLVFSTHPEEEFAIRYLRLGASGYVRKDSPPDEVAKAVRLTLAGRKYVTAAVAERLAGVVGGDTESLSHESLSRREMQVLRLVAQGRPLKQIATELRLSQKTIATYRARIAVKLNLSTKVELTRYALRHRLVD